MSSLTGTQLQLVNKVKTRQEGIDAMVSGNFSAKATTIGLISLRSIII